MLCPCTCPVQGPGHQPVTALPSTDLEVHLLLNVPIPDMHSETGQTTTGWFWDPLSPLWEGPELKLNGSFDLSKDYESQENRVECYSRECNRKRSRICQWRKEMVFRALTTNKCLLLTNHYRRPCNRNEQCGLTLAQEVRYQVKRGSMVTNPEPDLVWGIKEPPWRRWRVLNQDLKDR